MPTRVPFVAVLFVTIIFFPLGFRLPLWLRKAFKPAA